LISGFSFQLFAWRVRFALFLHSLVVQTLQIRISTLNQQLFGFGHRFSAFNPAKGRGMT
jgi:hypothetical protein